MRNTRIWILCFLVAWMGWFTRGWSQSAAYTFTSSTGTFDTLVGGTNVTAIEDDDEVSALLPIGFTFLYNGTSYTDVVASSNGFLSFNASSGSANGNNLDGTGSGQLPLVAPLWDDLDGRATGIVSEANYQTSGTAPNRIFTFEWKNWEWRYNADTAVISFQVKLYETTNVIEFHYRPGSGVPNTSATNGASIGLADLTSFLSVTDIANPTVSFLTETDTLSIRPDSGTVYSFTPPTCLIPDSLGSTNLAATTADVYWLARSGETQWEVEYGPIGFTLGTGTTVLATNDTTSLTMLMSSTEYEFYVRAICGPSDSSFWVGPSAPFFTSCVAVFQAPYSENFDGPLWQEGTGTANANDAISNCWTRFPATSSDFFWSTGAGTTGSSSTGPSSDNTTGSGNYVYTEGSNGSTGDTATLVSPQVDLSPLTNPTLSYAYHMYGSAIDTLFVEVNDGSGWTGVDTLIGEQQTASSDAWIVTSVDLAAFAGSTVQVRWRTSRGSALQNDIALDDVAISEPPCLTPNTLGVTAIATTDADVYWTPISGESQWEVEYGTVGFMQGAGTTVIATNDTTSLTMLMSSTVYEFYVRAICGPADSSGWAGPFAFTTLCPGVLQAPYSENFDGPQWIEGSGTANANDGINNCWSRIPATSSDFFWGTGSGTTGSSSTGPSEDNTTGSGNYAYTEGSNGATGDTANLISPEIDLSPLTNPYLEFAYHMYGSAIDTLFVDVNDGSGWVNVDSIAGPQQSASADPWMIRIVDLSAFINSTVQVRWRTMRGSSGTNDIALDDVSIYQQAVNDLGVVDYIAPASFCGDSNTLVQVVIENFGTATQTGFDVFVSWTGSTTGTISTTYSGSLAFGERDTVTVDTLNTTLGGTFNLNGYTSLTGDEDISNDTLPVPGVSFIAIPGAPMLVTPANQAICLGDTLTYVASGTFDTLVWRGKDGSFLALGDTLSLPNITSVDTFYVSQASLIDANVGPVDNTFGAGGNFTSTSGQSLEFDVLVPSTLDSITVYPSGSGTVGILIQDAANNTVFSNTYAITVSAAQEPVRLGLGVSLPVGTGYTINGTNSTVGLYRNSSGASYPYVSNGVVITGNTFGPAYYYFFYDWEITEIGCEGDGAMVTAVVNSVTVDLGSDTSYCEGDMFSFALDAGNAGLQYLWSDSSTAQTLLVDTAGTYWVEVTDTLTGCVGMDTLVITENPLPVVMLGADTAYCDNIAFSLTLDAGNAGSTYLWNDGSTMQTLIADTADTFWVEVTTASGCVDSDTLVVVENAAPVIALGNDTGYCVGTMISLTLDAGNTGLPYNWNDGSMNQTLLVDTAGIYWVEVTDTLNGCVGTDTLTVTENPLPMVMLGNDTAYCDNAAFSLTLDAGNAGSTYLWNDGSINQTLVADSAGQYWVEVTTAAGCVDSDTIEIIENAAPVVGLGNDTAYCDGDLFNLTLDAGNPGLSYLWNDASMNQTLLVDTAGIYWVEVTNTATGCVETDTLEVTENPLPVVMLGNDTAYCDNVAFSLTLDAGNAGSTYLWNDGSMNQTLVADSAGQYWVEVTTTAGCIDNDTIEITENPAPVVALGNDTAYCAGDLFNLMLDADNPGSTYMWNDNSTNQTIAVTSAGQYWVEVTTASGCIDTDTLEVTENALPMVTLGNDTAYCDNEAFALTLDADNVGSTYVWNDNSTQQTLAVNAAGIYWVEVTNANGCVGTDTLVVTEDAAPMISLSNASICEGDMITLDPGAGFVTYSWNTGPTTQTLDVTAAGTYTVTVTNTAGCSDTAEATITVNPLPMVDLGPDTGLSIGNTITLDAGNPGATYAWSTGANTRTIDVTYGDAPGTFTVTVTDASGCEGTGSIEITQFVGIEEIRLGSFQVFPNPVSTQATLEIASERSGEVTIEIYNTNGSLVRTFQDRVVGGTQQIPVDMYELERGVYFMHVTLDSEWFGQVRVVKM